MSIEQVLLCLGAVAFVAVVLELIEVFFCADDEKAWIAIAGPAGIGLCFVNPFVAIGFVGVVMSGELLRYVVGQAYDRV